MKFSRYNWIIPYDNKYILFNGFTGSIAITPDHKLANILLSDNPSLDLLEPDTINTLGNIGMIIPEDKDELDVLIDRYNNWKMLDRSPINTIVVTTKCNFNCSYCYQDSKTASSISTEVINAYCRLIKASDQKYHSITLYGGEPLLEFNACVSICSRARKIMEEKNGRFKASMITNGYLLSRSKLEIMKSVGIESVQITIDGDKKTHNKNRRHISGCNTYETILKNAIIASEYLRVTIRCNIQNDTNLNIQYLRDLCKNNNMKLTPSPVYHINDIIKTKCNMNDVYSMFNHDDRSRASNLNPRMPCIAVCDYPFGGSVLLPDGRTVRCWNEVSTTHDSLKSYGNIMESDNINIHNSIDWTSWNPYAYTKCKECKMLPTCAGGCPYYAVYNKEPRCSYISESNYETFIISNYVNER